MIRTWPDRYYRRGGRHHLPPEYAGTSSLTGVAHHKATPRPRRRLALEDFGARSRRPARQHVPRNGTCPGGAEIRRILPPGTLRRSRRATAAPEPTPGFSATGNDLYALHRTTQRGLIFQLTALVGTIDTNPTPIRKINYIDC